MISPYSTTATFPFLDGFGKVAHRKYIDSNPGKLHFH